MKVVHYVAYVMALVFIAGETSRRGLGYFSINATTMIEDYLCGALLLWAAVLGSKKHERSKPMMAVAWAYATGGMFVPFCAHLEASLRGVTFRADHPHEDVKSVVMKGAIWAICLACLIVTMRHRDAGESTD